MKSLKLSRRLTNIPEYIFAQLAREVKQVEVETGRKVLNFGPGTPDVPPSRLLLSKLNQFNLYKGSHRYPGYTGIPEFNQALTRWYDKRFGVSLEANEILPLLGGKDGVVHLPLVVADRGDAILVPDPGYPAYAGSMQLFGINAIPYHLDSHHGFRLSLAKIKQAITPRTKAIWVNFPSNPTGQIASLSELANLVQFAKNHNLIILFDNAYSEITFDTQPAPSILQVPGAKDVCIEIGSFSKTFSLAGFRLGWAVGNPHLITGLAKVKSQLDSGLSLPLQQLGAFALNHPDLSWHAKMIDSYRQRREVIAKSLSSTGLNITLPPASLYLWAKIPEGIDSLSFSHDLLRSRQVLVTPGIAFGSQGDRYVRISICTDIKHIKEFV